MAWLRTIRYSVKLAGVELQCEGDRCLVSWLQLRGYKGAWDPPPALLEAHPWLPLSLPIDPNNSSIRGLRVRALRREILADRFTRTWTTSAAGPRNELLIFSTLVLLGLGIPLGMVLSNLSWPPAPLLAPTVVLFLLLIGCLVSAPVVVFAQLWRLYLKGRGHEAVREIHAHSQGAEATFQNGNKLSFLWSQVQAVDRWGRLRLRTPPTYLNTFVRSKELPEWRLLVDVARGERLGPGACRRKDRHQYKRLIILVCLSWALGIPLLLWFDTYFGHCGLPMPSIFVGAWSATMGCFGLVFGAVFWLSGYPPRRRCRNRLRRLSTRE